MKVTDFPKACDEAIAHLRESADAHLRNLQRHVEEQLTEARHALEALKAQPALVAALAPRLAEVLVGKMEISPIVGENDELSFEVRPNGRRMCHSQVILSTYDMPVTLPPGKYRLWLLVEPLT